MHSQIHLQLLVTTSLSVSILPSSQLSPKSLFSEGQSKLYTRSQARCSSHSSSSSSAHSPLDGKGGLFVPHFGKVFSFQIHALFIVGTVTKWQALCVVFWSQFIFSTQVHAPCVVNDPIPCWLVWLNNKATNNNPPIKNPPTTNGRCRSNHCFENNGCLVEICVSSWRYNGSMVQLITKKIRDILSPVYLSPKLITKIRQVM